MSKTRPPHSGTPARNSRSQKIAPEPVTRPTGIFGRPPFVCLLLAAVTVAVFWPVTGHDFVIDGRNCDDSLYVTENAPVLRGLTLDGVG